MVLFGEPIRWETSLQLLIDVLVTNGKPSAAPPSIPYPHIPILACNMDLQWSAEAPMPRFGHGAFLLSLENLYKKVTNQELVYTALVGKPSEITFRHSEHVLQEQARLIYGPNTVKHIYFIGDNVCTDIFGANLYNRYLGKWRTEKESLQMKMSISRSIDHLLNAEEGELHQGATHCFGCLVETGVYSKVNTNDEVLNHSPRDFLPVEKSFQEPSMVVPHVMQAVDAIFDKENFE